MRYSSRGEGAGEGGIGGSRPQYAAMEAGGAAVAAPPKRGSSKTGQPQAVAAEIGPDLFGHDFLVFPLFFLFFPPIKRVFFPKKGAQLILIRDHHPIRIGDGRERLVTASPVMTKSRAPAGGNNYPENGLVKPPRRDTRALSPAGMFGGKAPLRLAAQSEEQTARAISAHAQCACLLSLQMGSKK